MEEKDLKFQFTIFLLVILLISFLFSTKGFVDNRRTVPYSRKLKEIGSTLEKESSLKEKRELRIKLREIQGEVVHYFRFPRLFFFAFVLFATAFAILAARVIYLLPAGKKLQRRCTLRFIICVAVFIITVIFFILLEYRRIARTGWVILIILLEWILIGGAAAFAASEKAYETILGLRRDKDLIEGPPPPAW